MSVFRKTLLSTDIRLEHDVVHVRQRARQIANLLGLDVQDQTRVATAISELARNAYAYAGGGKVEFWVEVNGQPLLAVRVQDKGPGIPHLRQILRGEYDSATGMGLGLLGAKRLMDRFDVQSDNTGTNILLHKYLPLTAPRLDDKRLVAIVAELANVRPQGPLEELQQQNREMVQALDALRARQEELAALNRELEDTNRGVVALYAELDEKADYLQRANETKTRFLADMTHEFRTPLNSILSLSRLLLDRVDGPLNREQEHQVALIRKAASSLSDLVNDLLDIAKVEAGRLGVKPRPFDIADLFGALRGMLKPLLAANTSVQLVFEEPVDVGIMLSDEAKISQILRNFISNALKFTESGEVRVRAARGPNDTVLLSVSDTGIGIAPEDQERIFEEFVQVESPLQRRTKGTGLGLPLSRKLAQLLGGDVMVTSRIGEGSTFAARIPLTYAGPAEVQLHPDAHAALDYSVRSVLVIEDNDESLLFYQKCLTKAGYHVRAARDLKTAREILAHKKPIAVVADILLEGEDAWNFISELKSDADTKEIPVVVTTVLDSERRARSLGAAAFHMKPVSCDWLVKTIEQLTETTEVVLMIDDDAAARYVLRGLLGARYRLVEAETASAGVELAQSIKPAAVVLDFYMPDMDGFTTLSQLRQNTVTRTTPVVMYTSKELAAEECSRLEQMGAVLLSKSDTTDTRNEAAEVVAQALARARSSVTS